jgi:hypothetical protein
MVPTASPAPHPTPPPGDPAELVRAAVNAYRRGESEYRAGLFEAGRLCGEYITVRLCAGEKRATAVELLTREMSRHGGGKVNVNRLVLVYQAHRLLAVEQGLTGTADQPGLADGVPFGVYRDAWCRLVKRVAKGTPQETFVLLPGLEQQCRDAFRTAVRDALLRRDVAELVTGLLRQKGKRRAAAAAERQDQPALAKNPTDQRGLVTGNLLTAAGLAQPRDLAELLVGAVEGSADPHATMQLLCELVAAAPWADRGMRRGAQAALLSLTRKDGNSTSPVNVAKVLCDGAPSFALPTRFVG